MLRRLRKLRHLSNPLGRRHLWLGAKNHAWPLLRPLAAAHRRTLTRRPRIVAVVGVVRQDHDHRRRVHRAWPVGAGSEGRCANLALTYTNLALKLLRVRPWQRHAAFEVAIDGPGQMAPYAAMLGPTWSS